jgi:chromosomal replication initiator protein
MATIKNISPWVIAGLDTKPTVITSDKVIFCIKKVLNITRDELCSSKRNREFTDARKLYALIMRKHTKKSTITIGLSIRKDHSTIVYATKQAKVLLEYDKNFNKNFMLIEELVVNPFLEYDRTNNY